eukprot:scaffold2261_cov405-Prasinococcus_capsulatus_cf.AAC.22
MLQSYSLPSSKPVVAPTSRRFLASCKQAGRSCSAAGAQRQLGAPQPPLRQCGASVPAATHMCALARVVELLVSVPPWS